MTQLEGCPSELSDSAALKGRQVASEVEPSADPRIRPLKPPGLLVDEICSWPLEGGGVSLLEPSLLQELFGWPPYAPQSYSPGLSSPGAVEGEFRLLDLWLYPVFGFYKGA